MNHKELNVRREAMELVKKIYQYFLKLPESENFILTSQLSKSAVSVAANIAEGAAGNSDKEFISFSLYYFWIPCRTGNLNDNCF